MTLTNPGAQELAGKRIAVVGLGKSGRATLTVLSRLTSAVLSAWDADMSALAPVASLNLDSAGSSLDPADLARKVLAWRPDIIVPAPAIAEIGPLYRGAEEAGVPVWSEIELAWRLRAQDENGWSAPWLCVTGTNGKTTTVSMTAAILRKAGLGGIAIGNIGNPAIEETTRTDDDAPRAFVLELSSFQLRSTHSMSPLASICLNFADDHLEWHGSREAYWRAKARIYENTQRACLYPVGDETVQKMVDNADVVEGARAIGVTVGVPSVGNVGLVENVVVDRAFESNRHTHGTELFEIEDIAHLAPAGSDLPLHIVKDALAAASLVRSLGVEPGTIRSAFAEFEPGHHRIELVGKVRDVRFVDDSKATNAHAARASLMAQDDGSVVWIAGGLAKGARFVDLVGAVAHKLRGVVVIGRDQEPWREALAQVEGLPISWVPSESANPMDEAVREGLALARPGDTVLLAPASASFDQFASYAARGQAFAHAVHEMDAS